MLAEENIEEAMAVFEFSNQYPNLTFGMYWSDNQLWIHLHGYLGYCPASICEYKTK